MVIEISGDTFSIEFHRDDAGNFVANALGPLPRVHAFVAAPALVARAVAKTKNEALESLKRSLERRCSAHATRS